MPSPTTAKQHTPKASEEDRSGLYLHGVVRARRRKMFPARDGGKPRWVVNFTILAAGQLMEVQQWSDTPHPPNIPERGEAVAIQVEARGVLIGKNPQVRLQIPGVDQGEEF